MPYRYSLSVEHLLTKVIYSTVSTDTGTKKVAYYSSWRNQELSGLFFGRPSHHLGAYYAMCVLFQCRTSVDEGRLSCCEYRPDTKEGAYYGSGSWRDTEHSGLLDGHAIHHRGACCAIRILSQCLTSVHEGHLSHRKHRY